MNQPQPVLNQLDLVVRDVDAAVAFYRRLGLDIPESAVWRTASGAHHVDLTGYAGRQPPYDTFWGARWRQYRTRLGPRAARPLFPTCATIVCECSARRR